MVFLFGETEQHDIHAGVVTVYVLEGASRRYVGITNDLERRLREHRTSSHSGALIGEFSVIHTEVFADYATARIRERYLKSGCGREWLAKMYPQQERS